MDQVLSRFTTAGMDEFALWIEKSSNQPVPASLLNDPSHAEPVLGRPTLSSQRFKSRYEFGRFLVDLLGDLDQQGVSFDRGLWTWLAAFFFDQICPVSEDGRRRYRKTYAYVLSDSRVYYRHLVRTPWFLVKTHGERCAFLLWSNPDDEAPLAHESAILGELAARQFVISSTSLIGAARWLYSNPRTGQPLRGQGAKGSGSPRRLALIANQLSLTYDIHDMPVDQLLTLLPDEFGVKLRMKVFG